MTGSAEVVRGEASITFVFTCASASRNIGGVMKRDVYARYQVLLTETCVREERDPFSDQDVSYGCNPLIIIATPYIWPNM